MAAHLKTTTPYKDATLDTAKDAPILLQDIVSDDVSYATDSPAKTTGASCPQSIAEGRYLCTTIRPGLQFINCDLRLLRSVDITAVLPKCISLSCLIDGHAATTIDRKFLAHPGRSLPHVMGIGQETEVCAHENKSQSLRMSGLLISGDFFDEIEDELACDLRALRSFMNPGCRQVTLENATALQQFLLQFQHAPSSGALGALYRESIGTAALLEFAATFSDLTPAAAAKPGVVADIAHDAKTLIDADPLAVTSIAGLARQLGTNETTLRRSFKATFGERVFSHLRSRRLERARTMIRAEQRQITEVAYECGYSDPANFTHAYRRHFGCTPRADQQ